MENDYRRAWRLHGLTEYYQLIKYLFFINIINYLNSGVKVVLEW